MDSVGKYIEEALVGHPGSEPLMFAHKFLDPTPLAARLLTLSDIPSRLVYDHSNKLYNPLITMVRGGHVVDGETRFHKHNEHSMAMLESFCHTDLSRLIEMMSWGAERMQWVTGCNPYSFPATQDLLLELIKIGGCDGLECS